MTAARTSLAAYGLVALVLLAGCAGLADDVGVPFESPGSDGRLGQEDGYGATDDLPVTPDDGFNESERAAVVARTMARLELIREREFTGNVTVEVVDRATYRNRSTGLEVEADPWNDQVWEALLLVGEDTGAHQALGTTLNGSVQGYYAPGNDSIVIVSDSPTPTLDRRTLAHELVHALQDQAGHLDRSPPTQDRQLASLSVTEGEANLVQALYENRCERRWDCLETPPRSGSSAETDGVFLVMYQPYATGPAFVDRARDAGGWDAVTALHEDVPNSTEQVIHPRAYPNEEPANVTVPDRSTGSWSRFDHDPVADTVGEASIYATFVANDVVSPDDRYAYESQPSAGWAGDAVVPYRNGSGGYGYVWRSRWDTERDARQFLDAYRSILVDRGATERADDVLVVPESDSFGDAFRLRRQGRTVTIVDAPTPDALDEVHPRPG